MEGFPHNQSSNIESQDDHAIVLVKFMSLFSCHMLDDFWDLFRIGLWLL
jgi:hypothetical protein